MKLNVLVCISLALFTSSVLSDDANYRKFIREGMAEGEVLFRIGKPDHESIIRSEKGKPEVKAWTYFPAYGDRQILTVITFRSGLVAEVKREIAR